jgi:hypothetical protein
MVKLSALALSALALLLLAGVASAQPPDDTGEYIEEPAEEPAFNMFGFRFSAGALPIEASHTTTLSVGLGVEHPVFKKTRVFGEYEWLWLTRVDVSERAMTSPIMRPEHHGTGHRASIGVRRELIGKRLGRSVRVFVDGELGAGVALVNDNMTGVAFLPSGLGGLRFGYDIYSRSDSSPSRTFEAEFLLRAIAIQGGVGGMAGLGMFWGN